MAVRTVVASVLSLVLLQAPIYAQETPLEPRGPKRTALRGPTVCVPMVSSSTAVILAANSRVISAESGVAVFETSGCDGVS